MPIDWAVETDRVVAMWKAGQSGAEIARVVRGATRSAVIAKLTRMGHARANPHEPVRRDCRETWTPEMVSELRGHIADGHGQTVIAKLMGLTYAQVRKKMAREGMKATRVPNKTWNIPSPSAPRALPKPVAPVTDAAAKRGKLWTERRFGECAFPVWGSGADAHSCGEPVADGRQYCPACCARMYTTPPPRRARDTRRLARIGS